LLQKRAAAEPANGEAKEEWSVSILAVAKYIKGQDDNPCAENEVVRASIVASESVVHSRRQQRYQSKLQGKPHAFASRSKFMG
jgi:hypothetical protein